MQAPKLVPLVIALAPLFAAPAHAVTLDPRGGGQVLLYPLYSVDRGNQTLMSIVNTSARGKALHVAFHEGFDNRTVLNFNLYLGPYDVWTAGIFSVDENGPAAILTRDKSCTVPSFGSVQYVPFRNYGYSGAQSDGGSSGLERTREGTIEVIEMGSLVSGSPAAVAAAHGDNGVPANCAALVQAWIAPDGFWVQDSTRDLGNPTGGLFGGAALVNVANGTMWSYNAAALEEFRQDPGDVPRGTRNSVVLHRVGSDPHPNLADALTDPSRDIAAASVLIDGKLVRAEYPAATRAIDAVTAALASDTLSNDYVVESAIGAQSEWIIDLPTKSFYTDPAIVGDAGVAPFMGVFGTTGYCMTARAAVFDREERTEVGCGPIGVPPPGYHCPTVVELCNVVQTAPFEQTGISAPTAETSSSFLAPRLSVVFGSGTPRQLGFASGWMRLELASSPGDGAHRMRPANDGTVFEGLPAIGFLATNYVNSAALPGLLANYSGAFAHRTTARCTREGAACP